MGAHDDNSLTDTDLVARVLSGDRNAFAPLVERYQAGIFNYAYRYTHNREEAADLAQETFLRAFRSLDRYNHRYTFRNWLYAIVTNTCHDWGRRQKNQPVIADLAEEESQLMGKESMEQSDPAEILVTSENTQAVAKAIAELPEDYRACLILFHIEGLSQAELCQVLQLPLTVVKNRLYRARLRLRQMLEVS